MSKKSSKTDVKNLTSAAVCLALCLVMALMIQNQIIGIALGPMHIPVLICGFITGPAYAVIVGLVAPLMGMMMFTTPMPFMAVAMCFELATYGLLAGLLYKAFPKKIVYIYATLIIAMLIGRFVWGLAAWQVTDIGFFGTPWETFTWEVFLTWAFIDAVPGIILHIVLIPLLIIPLRKIGIAD